MCQWSSAQGVTLRSVLLLPSIHLPVFSPSLSSHCLRGCPCVCQPLEDVSVINIHSSLSSSLHSFPFFPFVTCSFLSVSIHSISPVVIFPFLTFPFLFYSAPNFYLLWYTFMLLSFPFLYFLLFLLSVLPLTIFPLIINFFQSNHLFCFDLLFTCPLLPFNPLLHSLYFSHFSSSHITHSLVFYIIFSLLFVLALLFSTLCVSQFPPHFTSSSLSYSFLSNPI